MTINIDDDIHFQLENKSNKTEFIRQALREKLQREKQDGDSAGVEYLQTINKSLGEIKKELGQLKLLEEIKERVMNSEAKTMLASGYNRGYSTDIFRELSRINLVVSHIVTNVDKTFFDYAEEIRAAAEKKVLAFIENNHPRG